MGGDSLLVRHPPLRIQAQSQQAGQQDMVMKLTEFFGLSIQWMAIFGLMYIRIGKKSRVISCEKFKNTLDKAILRKNDEKE